MSNKKSLSQAFSENREQPEKDAESQAVSEYPKKRSQLPKSRKEKRSLTGWYKPETHRQVRMIAAAEDKTLEEVVGDALNLLFEKHDMPPIALD
jgi:hypothetical protein